MKKWEKPLVQELDLKLTNDEAEMLWFGESYYECCNCRKKFFRHNRPRKCNGNVSEDPNKYVMCKGESFRLFRHDQWYGKCS